MALSAGVPSQSDTQTTETGDETVTTAPAEQRRGLPKVSSGLNIANIYTEAQDGPI